MPSKPSKKSGMVAEVICKVLKWKSWGKCGKGDVGLTNVCQKQKQKQKIQSNNKGWEAKRRRLREAKEQMNRLRQETTEGWQLWLAALRVPLKQKNCSACKGFFTATVTQSAAVNKVNEQIIVTVSTIWNTIRVTHQKRLGKRGSEQVPSSGA